MFEITIVDADTFKKQMKVISDFVSEGKIKVNKNSFGLIAMDPSSVAMVDFQIFSSSCTEYTVNKEDEFAINFNNFYHILKTATPNAIINLSKDRNKLIVNIKAETDRTFKLPIIDFDEKDAQKANLDTTCKIILDSDLLKKEIDAAHIISESIEFITDEDHFNLKASGELSEFKADFKNIKVTTKENSKVKAKYSIEYLKKIMEVSAFCETVEINYAKDYASQIIFKEKDKFIIEFTLAPRVNDK